MNPKTSILYQPFKTDHPERLLLSLIEIIRRITYGANMILLHSSPYIQVIINSCFSCSICYFILLNKPYKSKKDNILAFYLEFDTFLIFSILGAFVYEDLEIRLYEVSEWALLVLIYMSIIVPATVNITILIKDILYKCKNSKDRVIETEIRNIQNSALTVNTYTNK